MVCDTLWSLQDGPAVPPVDTVSWLFAPLHTSALPQVLPSASAVAAAAALAPSLCSQPAPLLPVPSARLSTPPQAAAALFVSRWTSQQCSCCSLAPPQQPALQSTGPLAQPKTAPTAPSPATTAAARPTSSTLSGSLPPTPQPRTVVPGTRGKAAPASRAAARQPVAVPKTSRVLLLLVAWPGLLLRGTWRLCCCLTPPGCSSLTTSSHQVGQCLRNDLPSEHHPAPYLCSPQLGCFQPPVCHTSVAWTATL